MNMLNIETLVNNRIDDLVREAEEIRLEKLALGQSKPQGITRALWMTGKWISGLGKALQQNSALAKSSVGIVAEPEPCKSC